MHIWSSVTKETGVPGGNLICGVLESQTGSTLFTSDSGEIIIRQHYIARIKCRSQQERIWPDLLEGVEVFQRGALLRGHSPQKMFEI
jgi:hypothetical protein